MSGASWQTVPSDPFLNSNKAYRARDSGMPSRSRQCGVSSWFLDLSHADTRRSRRMMVSCVMLRVLFAAGPRFLHTNGDLLTVIHYMDAVT